LVTFGNQTQSETTAFLYFYRINLLLLTKSSGSEAHGRQTTPRKPGLGYLPSHVSMSDYRICGMKKSYSGIIRNEIRLEAAFIFELVVSTRRAGQ
jgi:hypothetical protein